MWPQKVSSGAVNAICNEQLPVLFWQIMRICLGLQYPKLGWYYYYLWHLIWPSLWSLWHPKFERSITHITKLIGLGIGQPELDVSFVALFWHGNPEFVYHAQSLPEHQKERIKKALLRDSSNKTLLSLLSPLFLGSLGSSVFSMST